MCRANARRGLSGIRSSKDTARSLSDRQTTGFADHRSLISVLRAGRVLHGGIARHRQESAEFFHARRKLNALSILIPAARKEDVVPPLRSECDATLALPSGRAIAPRLV